MIVFLNLSRKFKTAQAATIIVAKRPPSVLLPAASIIKIITAQIPIYFLFASVLKLRLRNGGNKKMPIKLPAEGFVETQRNANTGDKKRSKIRRVAFLSFLSAYANAINRNRHSKPPQNNLMLMTELATDFPTNILEVK
jgi:hypothetical protein